MPLCGHATLAAAAVLFQASGNVHSKLHFATLSGELTAEREGERVVLELPLHPPTPVEGGQFDALAAEAACGLPVLEVLLSRETRKLVVRLEDGLARAQLEAIRPRTDRLQALESSGRVAGVILTLRGRAGEPEAFYSRYFAPWNGIPEDPVTGSAHTVLAPYWGGLLATRTMVARQVASTGATPPSAGLPPRRPPPPQPAGVQREGGGGRRHRAPWLGEPALTATGSSCEPVS